METSIFLCSCSSVWDMLIRLRDQALLNIFFKQKAHHKSYNIHKKNHPVITGRGIWLFWVLVDLYNKNYVRGNN